MAEVSQADGDYQENEAEKAVDDGPLKGEETVGNGITNGTRHFKLVSNGPMTLGANGQNKCIVERLVSDNVADSLPNGASDDQSKNEETDSGQAPDSPKLIELNESSINNVHDAPSPKCDEKATSDTSIRKASISPEADGGDEEDNSREALVTACKSDSDTKSGDESSTSKGSKTCSKLSIKDRLGAFQGLIKAAVTKVNKDSSNSCQKTTSVGDGCQKHGAPSSPSVLATSSPNPVTTRHRDNVFDLMSPARMKVSSSDSEKVLPNKAVPNKEELDKEEKMLALENGEDDGDMDVDDSILDDQDISENNVGNVKAAMDSDEVESKNKSCETHNLERVDDVTALNEEKLTPRSCDILGTKENEAVQVVSHVKNIDSSHNTDKDIGEECIKDDAINHSSQNSPQNGVIETCKVTDEDQESCSNEVKESSPIEHASDKNLSKTDSVHIESQEAKTGETNEIKVDNLEVHDHKKRSHEDEEASASDREVKKIKLDTRSNSSESMCRDSSNESASTGNSRLASRSGSVDSSSHDSSAVDLQKECTEQRSQCTESKSQEAEAEQKKPSRKEKRSESSDSNCKKSRLDEMIGKLGSSIGIKPEEVAEDVVTIEEDSESEAESNESDSSGSDAAEGRKNKYVKISLKDLNKLVERRMKEYYAVKPSVIASLQHKINELQVSNETWKTQAKDLQKRIVEMSFMQNRTDRRRTCTKTTTRNMAVQVDEKKVQHMLLQSKSPQSAAAAAPPAAAAGAPPKSPRLGVPQNINPIKPMPVTMAHASPGQGMGGRIQHNTVREMLNQKKQKSGEKKIAPNSVAVQRPGGDSIIDLTDEDERATAMVRTAPTLVRATIPHAQSAQMQRFTLAPNVSGSAIRPGTILVQAPSAGGQVVLRPVASAGANPQAGTTLVYASPHQPPGTVLLQGPSNPVLRGTTQTQPPQLRQGQFIVQQPRLPIHQAQTLVTRAPPPLQSAPVQVVLSHPAPLPPVPDNPSNADKTKLLPPPKPSLKISRIQQGIVLSWNMTVDHSNANIKNYQLFAYQEGVALPSTTLWKKVGDVKALPLPMACTLTQFQEGNKYHFAVRAVDIHSRIGAFSDASSIHLTVAGRPVASS